MLHLYRRLLAARRASPALATGTIVLCDAPEPVVAFERHAGDARWRVLVNFTAAPVTCDGGGTVVVASDGVGEERPFDGVLRPDQAVLLRTPARDPD